MSFIKIIKSNHASVLSLDDRHLQRRDLRSADAMLRCLRASEEPKLQQQVHHVLHPRPRSPARAPERRRVLEDQ